MKLKLYSRLTLNYLVIAYTSYVFHCCLTVLHLSCTHVRAYTGCETSTHKKTWSARKCSFQKCLCTCFIYVVPNTDESWL